MNKTTKSVLARNLQRHLERAGMQQKELADALGVYPSTVTFWLQERSAPRADMVDEICKVLHIERADLILDEDVNAGAQSPSKTIPIFNSIYAEYQASKVVRYMAVDKDVKANFGIIISSDSMSDAGIHPQDVGFFSTNYKFKNGGVYAMWIVGSESIILKHVYIQNNQYTLMSANPNIAPIFIPNNEAFIIGELIGLYKRWDNEKI